MRPSPPSWANRKPTRVCESWVTFHSLPIQTRPFIEGYGRRPPFGGFDDLLINAVIASFNLLGVGSFIQILCNCFNDKSSSSHFK